MRFRCLLTALVLLATFASDSWSQSKQPSPKASQQKAAQQERGSEDSPVVVKVIPTEKPKDELAREDAKDKEKTAIDRQIASLTGELALYTKLLFAATAVLALITFGLVVVGFRQVRDAKQAIAAAVDSAAAARISAEAFMNAEGAQIFPVLVEDNLKESLAGHSVYF